MVTFEAAAKDTRTPLCTAPVLGAITKAFTRVHLYIKRKQIHSEYHITNNNNIKGEILDREAVSATFALKTVIKPLRRWIHGSICYDGGDGETQVSLWVSMLVHS